MFSLLFQLVKLANPLLQVMQKRPRDRLPEDEGYGPLGQRRSLSLHSRSLQLKLRRLPSTAGKEKKHENLKKRIRTCSDIDV
jgi:hypothetical protein